ncbi:alpha-13-glucanase mutanase protein [Rutstroemia sp. NJR-2017a BBW]|nr:alpha-13-glucanase mutanase protein [Rutstroemia sp. NJR-2017a BBW]
MRTQLNVFHAYAAVFLLYLSSFVSSSPVSKVNAAAVATPRYVFAHFMVGIVQDYTLSDWKMDMSYAQEIGIDAFALNCASIDSYTPTQLALAYQAASEVGFHVFISFDFAYWNNGNTNNITDYMNKYASHPGQMQYNGGAVVSTFVGDNFNWAPVKAGTNHSIFAIPMMQDPVEVTYLQTGFDGAFSWLAWPTDGGNSIIPGPMTTVWDDKFLKNLAGRPYMAPVSPWFSTHFNSKNWVFICEELITDRWNQMLTMQPALIEIISWNDYGESHYIGPAEPHHTDDGSSQWADGFPHDGWRIISKPYIAAYKAGATTPSVTQDQLVYWYRPTPKDIKCTNDTLGPPNGIQYLADEIFVTTLLKSPATLIVTSGSNTPVAINVPAGIVTTNFTMGVGNQYFQVTRNGSPILSGYGGLNIANTCQKYNYNAYLMERAMLVHHQAQQHRLAHSQPRLPLQLPVRAHLHRHQPPHPLPVHPQAALQPHPNQQPPAPPPLPPPQHPPPQPPPQPPPNPASASPAPAQETTSASVPSAATSDTVPQAHYRLRLLRARMGIRCLERIIRIWGCVVMLVIMGIVRGRLVGWGE